MGRQAGAILLLVLVLLLLLAGLSVVGLTAQQQFVRAEQLATVHAERESLGLRLLKEYQPQWEQWLPLWPPVAEELEGLCVRHWFFAAGGACEQSLNPEGLGRLWWLWQHQEVNESQLTLVLQPQDTLLSEHFWAWDLQLRRHEEAWQPGRQRWYKLRHPVTGAWRYEEGESWWSGVLP